MGQCKICDRKNQLQQLQKTSFSNPEIFNQVRNIKSNHLEQLKNFRHIQRTKSSTYYGSLIQNNTILQGYGQYNQDGNLYLGEFKNNKFHGKGVLVMLNGDCLAAQFKQGLPDGQGWDQNGKTFFKGFYQNGKRKKGIMKNALFQYKGQFGDINTIKKNCVLKLNNNDVFKGTINKNIFSGYGQIFLKNGSSYKGKFKDDKFSGYGIYKWNNGDTYDGQYLDGFKDGYGRLNFNKNMQYAGKWKRGKRNGKGILKIQNEMAFGLWQNDNIVE